MKKILYFVVFTFLCFVGVGDVFGLSCEFKDVKNGTKLTFDGTDFKLNGTKVKVANSAKIKNSCPKLVIYNGKKITDIYYSGDSIVATTVQEGIKEGKAFVEKGTPMAYCEYKDSTRAGFFGGYVGNTAFAGSTRENEILEHDGTAMTPTSYKDKAGLPYCTGAVNYRREETNYVSKIYVTFGKANNDYPELAPLENSYTHIPNNVEGLKNDLSCNFGDNFVVTVNGEDVKVTNTQNGWEYIADDDLKSSMQKAAKDKKCPNIKICYDKQPVSSPTYVKLTKGGATYTCVGFEEETKDAEDFNEMVGNRITGEKFKSGLKNLYPYLVEKGVSDGKKLYIDGNELPISRWGFTNKYSCDNSNCADNFETEMEYYIMDIATYCNEFYNSYYKTIGKNNNNDLIDKRMNECISFDEYYTWLVQQGYVNNLQGECGIISQDMIGVINWVLNIIKIAGPILAIVLGMLDFAKVMVAEDADKTYKEAWKKFIRRIIAAVLLLLTPMLLSFILNFALGGQDGYDTENPFCNMVDWSEVSE